MKTFTSETLGKQERTQFDGKAAVRELNEKSSMKETIKRFSVHSALCLKKVLKNFVEISFNKVQQYLPWKMISHLYFSSRFNGSKLQTKNQNVNTKKEKRFSCITIPQVPIESY